MKRKYIFISGGVISGLGKGITAASLGAILKSFGLKVAPIKCDAYVNIDAGTVRPQEHGEVFVTADGIETDQDLGHYERFLGESVPRENYITTGQIYQEIIRKERNFEYGGEDVEVVPHVPEEMIRRFKVAGDKSNADIVLIEIGGTVGEYQNILFIEANRIMKVRDHEDVIHIHVAYLPTPPSIGEMKSKPAQLSVRMLNETGIQPDFLVARAEHYLDEPRKARLSMFCNLEPEDVISNPDMPSIYMVPKVLDEQGLGEKVLKKLDIKPKKKKDLKDWYSLAESIEKINASSKKVRIGIVGKYQKVGDYKLEDAYVCVMESIKHAAWKFGVKPEVVWFNTEEIEENGVDSALKDLDGIIVPQGWGSRGVEGKIETIRYARENKIPYLGLCFGMQMAVIEFGRNVLGLKNANSVEADPKTPYPVVHIMPEQKEYLAKRQYGGTIRLGAWPCAIKPKTKLFEQYKKDLVHERHRHRYEFNNEFRQKYEEAGMVFSGTSPDGNLVEAIELPQHPFFIGTQFHPEYQSYPFDPNPVFMGFLKACLDEK